VNDDALRRSTEFLVKAKTEYLRSYADSSSEDEGDISLTGKIRQPGSRLDDSRRRSDPRRWAVPSPAARECLQVQRPQKDSDVPHMHSRDTEFEDREKPEMATGPEAGVPSGPGRLGSGDSQVDEAEANAELNRGNARPRRSLADKEAPFQRVGSGGGGLPRRPSQE
jgi:hypothetical protein